MSFDDSNKILTLFFEVNGYQKPFHRDRKENSGGGLLVYVVKNEVSCKRRPDLESEQLECIWLEVNQLKSKSFWQVMFILL